MENSNTEPSNNFLDNKSDEEIKEEIKRLRNTVHDRINWEDEKDLILQEREKLDYDREQLKSEMDVFKDRMKEMWIEEMINKEYSEANVTDKPEDGVTMVKKNF